MTTATMRHFDALDYVKKSKALGATEALAEYQARQIEDAIDIAVLIAKYDIENKELATKGDLALTNTEIIQLSAEIKQVELRLQNEIGHAKNQTLLIIGSFGVFFLGILAKGFHWL